MDSNSIVVRQLTEQIAAIIKEAAPALDSLTQEYNIEQLQDAADWMRKKIETIETIAEFKSGYKADIRSQLFIIAGFIQTAILMQKTGDKTPKPDVILEES